jgi:hypothetical protein
MDAMVLCAHSLLGHHGWKMMRLLPRRRLCSAAAVSQPLAGTSSATVAGNKLARDTKRVLRRLPSPVVVVTTKGKDGTLRGITCSSFTSVSLDPPIVSFCITRPSSTADMLLASRTCAVNLLSGIAFKGFGDCILFLAVEILKGKCQSRARRPALFLCS